MLKFWLIIFYFINIIVSASPWTEWVFHSFFVNFFYFLHLASWYAIELLILSLIYVYLLLYLLKHLYNSILKYGFMLIVFFLFQFYFMLFYGSGLVWSIEFWYGKFFSYSFFEYLASDFRIFFSTCVVLVLCSLNRFISNWIKQAYLRSYNQQHILELNMTKRFKTMLSNTRYIKINLIFFFLLLSIVYLYYPSYLIHTFHWYSTLSWTFTYDAVTTKSVDYYSYYKYLWINVTQLYCILYILTVHLPLLPHVNIAVKNKMQMTNPVLRLPLVNISKVNLVTSASDLKQKKNLINKKKNNFSVTTIFIAVKYNDTYQYPLIKIVKNYFSSVNNGNKGDLELGSMIVSKKINWLEIETAYISQKYKLWFAAGRPEQKPTFKSFSLVNEENTLTNENDNILTSLNAIKDVANKVFPESKATMITKNLDALLQAYQTSAASSTTYNALQSCYKSINIDAWSYQQITDLLLVLHKIESKLLALGCNEKFLETHSIFNPEISWKMICKLKRKNCYLTQNKITAALDIDNTQSSVANPELFKKFMNSLYDISPVANTPEELDRYYLKFDGSTWLDNLDKQLTIEDWRQFPTFQVGDFQVSEFTRMSEGVVQAYLDFSNLVIPPDSSYGAELFQNIKKVCTMDPTIDETLIINDDSYRHEQWDVCLQTVKNCFFTYENLLNHASKTTTADIFPGVAFNEIAELNNMFKSVFLLYSKIFEVNTGHYGVNFWLYHIYQGTLSKAFDPDFFFNTDSFKCRDIMSPHFIQLFNTQLHEQAISSKNETLKLIQHLIDRDVIVQVDVNKIIPSDAIFTVNDLTNLYNKIPAEELYIHLPNMEAFLLNQASILVDTTFLSEKLKLNVNDQLVTSLPRDLTVKQKTLVGDGIIVEEKNPPYSVHTVVDDIPNLTISEEPTTPSETPLTLDVLEPVTWFTTIWNHVDMIVNLITSWWG